MTKIEKKTAMKQDAKQLMLFKDIESNPITIGVSYCHIDTLAFTGVVLL